MSTAFPLPGQGTDLDGIIREIKAWTARQGMNQTQVARAIDMDPAQYSRCLNGQRAMRVEELLAIAKVLDVDPRVFWKPSVKAWPDGRPDDDDPGPGDGPGRGRNTQALDRLREKKRRYPDDDGTTHQYAA